MSLKHAYRHCPRCAGVVSDHQKFHLRCRDCGLDFYFNPAPCNAVILENEKGEILLVKRKLAPGRGKWSLPGGFVDPGENLEESVKREMKEELGLAVVMGGIVGVYHDSYRYQGYNYPTIGTVVTAKVLEGKEKPADDVSGCQFVARGQILGLELAFVSVRQALSDYLL